MDPYGGRDRLTDLLISMENPSESMLGLLLNPITSRFEWSSPIRSPPTCVSSDADSGSGDGRGGGESEGGEHDVFQETSSCSEIGGGEVDGAGVTEPAEPEQVSHSTDPGVSDHGFDEAAVDASPSSLSPDSDRPWKKRLRYGEIPEVSDHGSDGAAVDSSPSSISPDSDRSWKKRPRYGEIPEFREPSAGRKTALEGALRKFADMKAVYPVAPQIGMEFDSLTEAYEFYNLYSWEIGFGIRYGASRKNEANCKISQDILCGCAGKPRHPNSRSISRGCQAMIRLHRTPDYGWFIAEFRPNHNHGLANSNGEKLHWDFHKRKIFILDPTMNNGEESDKVMQTHHTKQANELHAELEKCIHAFFIGWKPDMTKWKTMFPKGLNSSISRSGDSGVYAAHYARNWMGNKLKRALSQHNDGIMHGRMNMLMDVLGFEGNIGIVPERYRACMIPSTGKAIVKMQD